MRGPCAGQCLACPEETVENISILERRDAIRDVMPQGTANRRQQGGKGKGTGHYGYGTAETRGRGRDGASCMHAGELTPSFPLRTWRHPATPSFGWACLRAVISHGCYCQWRERERERERGRERERRIPSPKARSTNAHTRTWLYIHRPRPHPWSVPLESDGSRSRIAARAVPEWREEQRNLGARILAALPSRIHPPRAAGCELTARQLTVLQRHC